MNNRCLFGVLLKHTGIPSFDFLYEIHIFIKQLKYFIITALLDHLKSLIKEHLVELYKDILVSAEPVSLFVM